MKYIELKKLLKANNCKRVGEYKGHEKWYSPITKQDFPVGRHDGQEVANGTLKAIEKQSGIKIRG
ncbi:MAG: type II toxin-antitoxin system HicA family toxin [Treponema sp.]|nr:type II toxin-antitoxin system HicA family toxin [Treponema sp.]